MAFRCEDTLPIPTKDITSWYFDEPQCDPELPIYIDAQEPSRSISHNQARSLIRRLVAGFRAIGLQKGDCVCLHSFNDINYPIVVNGIVAAGCIYTGTNPGYKPYELAHAVKAAGIKFFIVEPEILPNVLKAADDGGIPHDRILIFDNRKGQTVPQGFKSWRTLLEHGEADWERFDDLETSRTRDVARLFSSGTTGLPKAAALTHYNFIAQHGQVNDWKPKPYKERRLMATPMFHVATAPCTHFSPLRNGVATYIMRRFELESWLKAVETHHITDTATVPPMVIAIINSDITPRYSLKSVKFAACGASPLEKGPQARFRKLLAEDAVFTQVWGMTETTCIATNFPYPSDDDTGSVGRPIPGMELKLVDDDGKDITGYDIRGELCVRGPTVIRGYLDEKATAASWDKDGFFHTGDVCYCAQDSGKWYVVDRKKELIKVRGFQVAPPELEAVLLAHPHIVDAAVIGVKPSKDDQSEYPRGYVVRRKSKKGNELTAETVKIWMRERLAEFKRLEGGVVFLDEIPKNPSGKILKRELRERATEELKTERRTSRL